MCAEERIQKLSDDKRAVEKEVSVCQFTSHLLVVPMLQHGIISFCCVSTCCFLSLTENDPKSFSERLVGVENFEFCTLLTIIATSNGSHVALSQAFTELLGHISLLWSCIN